MGFIREFNNNSAYGKGTYFARDMSYSADDRYSPYAAKWQQVRVLGARARWGALPEKCDDEAGRQAKWNIARLHGQ